MLTSKFLGIFFIKHRSKGAAVAPAAPNKAVSTATTILTIVFQFLIFYLLSSLLMFNF